MTVPGLIGWVCGATAETVAILMLLLFLAGCFGLLGLLVFGPETVAGATDENVFQRRLADGDGLNIAGEGFDHIGHEAVPLFAFEAYLAVEGRGFDAETLVKPQCQG